MKDRAPAGAPDFTVGTSWLKRVVVFLIAVWSQFILPLGFVQLAKKRSSTNRGFLDGTVPNFSLARSVSIGFWDADWTVDTMVASASRAFKKCKNWLSPLAVRCIVNFDAKPSLAELEKFISQDSTFRIAVKVHNVRSVRVGRILGERKFVSLQWDLPKIETSRELATWLGIRLTDLDWLANLHPSDPYCEEQLSKHYVCRWIRKRASGFRLIESPKPLLKDAQRKILAGILDRITSHDASHGFCKGRSVVSFVEPHVAKTVCLRMDLQDFFPSITFGRVWGVFRNAGYSRDVAIRLAGICTCATDEKTLNLSNTGSAEQLDRLRKCYSRRHLPQGAPTSPRLANLVAHQLDARLHGLATSVQCSYTRYADDLLFSGDKVFDKSSKRFATTVGAIVIEEGFRVRFRKTRLMRASQRQHAAGVVINESTNLRRSKYDELKAILFNCIRFGPESQNRLGHDSFRKHLEGRIQWVKQLNGARSQKLQALFERIDWP